MKYKIKNTLITLIHNDSQDRLTTEISFLISRRKLNIYYSFPQLRVVETNNSLYLTCDLSSKKK